MLDDDTGQRQQAGNYFLGHMNRMRHIVAMAPADDLAPMIPVWVSERHREVDTAVYSSRKSFLRQENPDDTLMDVEDEQLDKYYKNYLQGMGETEKAFVAAVSRLGRYPIVGGLAVKWHAEGVRIESAFSLHNPELRRSFHQSVNNMVNLARGVYRQGTFKAVMYNARDTLHLDRRRETDAFIPPKSLRIPYLVTPAPQGDDTERMHSYFEDGRDPDEYLTLPPSIMDEIEVPDLTAPGEPFGLGARHPISLITNKIIDIFGRIGFTVAEEREIEDDWYNFTAMNTPEDHPARDMQDTFYLKDDAKKLLRTHTSSVQARIMEHNQPPIRIIAPGRVYRNETISARSHCQFHQVEGLYIAENVSFADLKQTLLYFAKEMYGASKIRLRPSYFPFTEPSAEMDIYWGLESETDYRITKGTGWLEILGCGMVDPNVLKNCGIDPEKYSGFAFGMGIERQAMLKYNISDIRYLFENDIRFLNQFEGAL